jgi:hypothetical protein
MQSRVAVLMMAMALCKDLRRSTSRASATWRKTTSPRSTRFFIQILDNLPQDPDGVGAVSLGSRQ